MRQARQAMPCPAGVVSVGLPRRGGAAISRQAISGCAGIVPVAGALVGLLAGFSALWRAVTGWRLLAGGL